MYLNEAGGKANYKLISNTTVNNAYWMIVIELCLRNMKPI